jgi:hypothetical protein
MTTMGDLGPRYAPGEDVGPLVRGLGGGLLGGAAGLLLDRLVVSPGGFTWLWPALFGSAVWGDPTATAAGAAVSLTLAGALGLVFVYGQVRRFVPGRPIGAGMAWGAVIALGALAGLLPRSAAWMASPGVTPARLMGMSAAAMAEVVVTALVYGAIVGWLNPRRDDA